MLEIWSWKWKTQSFQRLIASGQIRIPMDKELEAPARMPRMRLILRGEETDLWTRKQRRRRRSPVLALSPVSPLLLSGRHVTSTYVTLEKVYFDRLSVINKPPKLGSTFSAGSDMFCFFWISPKAKAIFWLLLNILQSSFWRRLNIVDLSFLGSVSISSCQNILCIFGPL